MKFNIPEDEYNKFGKNNCEPYMSYIITRDEIVFVKSCLKIRNLSDALLSQLHKVEKCYFNNAIMKSLEKYVDSFLLLLVSQYPYMLCVRKKPCKKPEVVNFCCQ